MAAELTPLAEALRLFDRALAGWPRVGTETVATSEGQGRRLAADQHSRLDIPPFDKAAMDGYAVLAGDERDRYRLVGTTAAGAGTAGQLEAGTAVKVMTGAPVPAGSGCVIQREFTSEEDGFVSVLERGVADNICRRAEDVRRGQLVAERGRRLGALEIANLVSCGIGSVEVYKPVSIAIISTGDELVERIEQLGPGKIINSNGPLLAALAGQYGLEVQREVTIADDPAEIEQALRESLEAADLVVLSGGVSVGDFDYVPAAIERLGMQVHFSRLAVKPGRPTTFATAPGWILLGLPGNPVGVYLMFHLLALRAVGHLYGLSWEPRDFRLKLSQEVTRGNGERLEYVPARLLGDACVELLEYHGSAHQATLLKADGFAILPIGRTEFPAGCEVQFMPLGMGWSNA